MGIRTSTPKLKASVMIFLQFKSVHQLQEAVVAGELKSLMTDIANKVSSMVLI